MPVLSEELRSLGRVLVSDIHMGERWGWPDGQNTRVVKLVVISAIVRGVAVGVFPLISVLVFCEEEFETRSNGVPTTDL